MPPSSLQAPPSSHELELVQVLTGHSDRAWSIAWHPTRPILASSSSDKQLRLHRYHLLARPDAPEPVFEFAFHDAIPSAHTRTVRSLDWSPSGLLLASGSFDSTTSVWATDRAQLHPRLGSPHSDGSSHPPSPLAEPETESWECALSLEGHESEVKGVAWNRTGSLLATCSRDKSVWIWEILVADDDAPGHALAAGDEGYEVVSVLMEHEQDVKSVCWSPVEDLLCSTSYDNNIHLYAEDATSDGDFSLVHRLSGHTSTVWDASFSACGEFLASCSDDLSIRIWHREKIARGGVEGRDGGLSGGWRIGRSERERWTCTNVISGHHSRTIYSLDWTLNPQISCLGTAPEGDFLGMIVSCGGDGRMNIFEIAKGEAVSGLDSTSPQLDVNLLAQRKNAHGVSDINAVGWCKVKTTPIVSSPSRLDWTNAAQQLLASAGDDGAIRIWRIKKCP